MSQFAVGHSWLFHKMKYRNTFGVVVPEWILVSDVPVKLDLIRVTLRTGIVGATELTSRDFHDG